MEYQKAEKFIVDKLKKELPKRLFYHSINHVEDVFQAAVVLAKLEGISDDDFQLLKIAVLFHDSGFIVHPKEHEATGCKIVRENLPFFGYSTQQIEKICGMIMATKIPQDPHNLLEEIICDADLDYLGRDDYDSISNNLFKEINANGNLDEESWLKLQISFLETHHYYTASALRMRKQKKEDKLKSLKQTLAGLNVK